MSRDSLWELGIASIKSLESDQGILASGRNEAYGCLFGRDSLLTGLDLLGTYAKGKDPYFLSIVEKSLRTLSNLQGRFTNRNSGEEPGKIIHEYRVTGHEHLTQLAENPWFIYPEGVMKNYDTVDATPLFLIALDEFFKHKGTMIEFLPSARAALDWLMTFDGFVTYQIHPERTSGGLKVQSWMDSTESLFYDDSKDFPRYPIAPVEVQAYAWAAYMRWADYFAKDEPELAATLRERASKLKEAFNKHFVLKQGKTISLAYALDGNLIPLTAARSSMGHVLWAAYKGECILDKEYIEPLRNRLLSRDLFVPKAGIRTLSVRSTMYDPQSYHNGSIWPHDSAMLAKGLENFGFVDDAKRVREALINAYMHFKTPLELYTYSRGLKPYKTTDGHEACQVQAWSAASLLSILE